MPPSGLKGLFTSGSASRHETGNSPNQVVPRSETRSHLRRVREIATRHLDPYAKHAGRRITLELKGLAARARKRRAAKDPRTRCERHVHPSQGLSYDAVRVACVGRPRLSSTAGRADVIRSYLLDCPAARFLTGCFLIS